ncbi:MAG: hypothetical protein K6G06_09160 [Butyrivibrio sp.]|nr:hypothetical protein [Butyrivibrio sp.]
MDKNIRIIPKEPYPMGFRRTENGFMICASFNGGAPCGVILYPTGSGKGEKITLPEDCRYGNVLSAEVIGDFAGFDRYMLFEGKRVFCDPYAKHIVGLEKWAKDIDEEDLFAKIDENEFNWEKDKRPNVKYEDSFVYTLHVRGYTKSPSSGVDVKKRGTYAGIIDKIPYIKSLGVTTVELMPTYELDVLDVPSKPSMGSYGIMPEGSIYESKNTKGKMLVSENGTVKNASRVKHRINFWGYKKGFYFAPRTAYAQYPEEADIEFKNMVKAFHKNGIEVVMQFFFTDDEPYDLVLSAIRHWAFNYHIDGIHFKGSGNAAQIAALDPALSDLKLWYYGFDYGKICGKNNKAKVLGEFLPEYMYASRRFLKGDDNTIGDFIRVMLNNKDDCGTINYICDYEGFRLCDLVTYEHKRNETNGENNADGTDNNLSWNCGIEGRTRKQAILNLRNKQIKNALTMLFMSQGTPMIFGGDEFGNSQDGNNNPYCQDNPTGWVDWSQKDKPLNAENLEYLKFLVKLRFKYRILHEKKAFKLMDYISCGYPDLSYHGMEAWRPDLSNYSHSVGMLYCGLYEKEDKDQNFFYVAYNMHWTPVSFALPKLPEGMKWHILSDTEEPSEYKHMHVLKNQDKVECTERSIKILIGVGKPILKKDKKLKDGNK